MVNCDFGRSGPLLLEFGQVKLWLMLNSQEIQNFTEIIRVSFVVACSFVFSFSFMIKVRREECSHLRKMIRSYVFLAMVYFFPLYLMSIFSQLFSYYFLIEVSLEECTNLNKIVIFKYFWPLPSLSLRNLAVHCLDYTKFLKKMIKIAFVGVCSGIFHLYDQLK